MQALVLEKKKVLSLRDIDLPEVLGPHDVRPLITDRYAFPDSLAAFGYASAPKPNSVKVQIEPG